MITYSISRFVATAFKSRTLNNTSLNLTVIRS